MCFINIRTVFPNREKNKLDALYPEIASDFECSNGALDRHRCGMANIYHKKIKVLAQTNVSTRFLIFFKSLH